MIQERKRKAEQKISIITMKGERTLYRICITPDALLRERQLRLGNETIILSTKKKR